MAEKYSTSKIKKLPETVTNLYYQSHDHCTEPFPEEPMERIRQYVMLLDVDDWYTRVHNWTLDGQISFRFTFTTEIPPFNHKSLSGLATHLDKIERHIRHQIVGKSSAQFTSKGRPLVSQQNSASSAERAAAFNLLCQFANSAGSISSNESTSNAIVESFETLDIPNESPLALKNQQCKRELSLHTHMKQRIIIVIILNNLKAKTCVLLYLIPESHRAILRGLIG